MHVILIILGFCLLIFGGGCVLILGGLFLSTSPKSSTSDLMSVMEIGGVFGLLPLVIGLWLFRWGLRIDRAKRKANIVQAQDAAKDKQP